MIAHPPPVSHPDHRFSEETDAKGSKKNKQEKEKRGKKDRWHDPKPRDQKEKSWPTTAPKDGGTRKTTPTTGEGNTGTRGWDQKSKNQKKRGPAVLGIPVPSRMTVLTKPLAA